MGTFLSKWLPIVFGCHCRPDRSFFWKGTQFPICARCTGELIGMTAALVLCCVKLPSLWVCVLLLLPMIADGFIQLLTRYESSNPLRCVTGILFGIGLMALILHILAGAFSAGLDLGRSWRIS